MDKPMNSFGALNHVFVFVWYLRCSFNSFLDLFLRDLTECSGSEPAKTCISAGQYSGCCATTFYQASKPIVNSNIYKASLTTHSANLYSICDSYTSCRA